MLMWQACKLALRNADRVGERCRLQTGIRHHENCAKPQLERGLHWRQLAAGRLSLGNAVHSDRQQWERSHRQSSLRVGSLAYHLRLCRAQFGQYNKDPCRMQRVRCFIHRLISPMHQSVQVWCIGEINRWIKQHTQCDLKQKQNIVKQNVPCKP